MTTALEGAEGSASRRGRSLPPAKTRYPLYRRLGGPQGRSGQVRKISPPTGNRSPDRPARSSVAIPTELPGPPTVITLIINVTQMEATRLCLIFMKITSTLLHKHKHKHKLAFVNTVLNLRVPQKQAIV